MRNISKYSDLCGYGLEFEQAESFKVSYVGYYEGKDKKSEIRVFSIAPAMDGNGTFCGKPVRYAIDSMDERIDDPIVTGLAEDGYKVVSEKTRNYYEAGKKLLYRDVKELPIA